MATVREAGPDDVTAIREVHVHPDHAQEGVGTAIVRAMERRAGAEGPDRLDPTASLDAVPFYEARGFEAKGPTPYELADGVELEVWTMEKAPSHR